MAELLAFMAKNRSLSYCKVVEAIAETTAPLTPMEKLLEKIPPQRVKVDPPKVFILIYYQQINNIPWSITFYVVKRSKWLEI